MSDPLGEVVSLLRPVLTYSKIASAAGPWRLRKEPDGSLFFSATLSGSCLLEVEGREPITLMERDFLLMPDSAAFTMRSLHSQSHLLPFTVPERLESGEYRLGELEEEAEIRNIVGHCRFESPDSSLILSLLPSFIHVRGGEILPTLCSVLREEARLERAGQSIVLSNMLEIMLIEALRTCGELTLQPGLLKGLSDPKLALVLRLMHGQPGRRWTVETLARSCGLSRSAFYLRFTAALGVAPMAYLATWRMALAKDMLRRGGYSMGELADRTGYGSASAFSTAFTRATHVSPARYAREILAGSSSSGHSIPPRDENA
ncbi:helix-turn-helix transcriptional regulator [Asaia krungthepensis]|uniref:AraC family transcriptional regulator n=1 Tax=Asaia krungthepensis NRIC 0535 TaxID=1307925 RepID=A0ABQ0Q5T3_9PROT|nr:AraC family transcriptional regulator [Asaia krungthepensis]GBQ92633.1 AraC family transcriptional regulator [Asaia krungthepensis NRIC 0535]